MPATVRPGTAAETAAWLDTHWQGSVVAHGTSYTAADVDCLVAVEGDQVVGAVTYHLDEHGLEIVTVDADRPRQGVGTALVAAVVAEAGHRGAARVWLTTTNDNLDALGFYQAIGFRLCALRPGAVAQARRVKASIPLEAVNGLPIRDELDLELMVGSRVTG